MEDTKHVVSQIEELSMVEYSRIGFLLQKYALWELTLRVLFSNYIGVGFSVAIKIFERTSCDKLLEYLKMASVVRGDTNLQTFIENTKSETTKLIERRNILAHGVGYKVKNSANILFLRPKVDHKNIEQMKLDLINYQIISSEQLDDDINEWLSLIEKMQNESNYWAMKKSD